MNQNSYKDVLMNPNFSLTLVQQVLRDWFLVLPADSQNISKSAQPKKIKVNLDEDKLVVVSNNDKQLLNTCLAKYKLLGHPKKDIVMKAIQILHPKKLKQVNKRALSEEEIRVFKRTFCSNKKYGRGFDLLLKFWLEKDKNSKKSIENAALLLGLCVKNARADYENFNQNLKKIKQNQN